MTLKNLKTILSPTDRLNKELLRPEVLEVAKYINQKLVICGKELKVRNVISYFFLRYLYQGYLRIISVYHAIGSIYIAATTELTYHIA